MMKSSLKGPAAIAVPTVLPCTGRYWAVPLLAASLLVGCGDSASQPTTADSTRIGAGSTESPSEAVGANSKLSDQEQPVVVQNGLESDASHCVAVFLDSLRRGDERAANGVLTEKARQELAKTAYVIEPLGTPQGSYEIGRVGFPYEDKSIALVECTWTEPPMEDEQFLTMDIVCEVRRETEGWRISGMGVSLPGTDEAIVLDFEDAESLEATIEAATGSASSDQQIAGQVTPDGTQQVAQQPSSAAGQMATSNPSSGDMPATALPGYPPQQEISVENSAPPQLAYPAQSDAEIRR